MDSSKTNKGKQELKMLILHGYQQSPPIFIKRLKSLFKFLEKQFQFSYIMPRAPHDLIKLNLIEKKESQQLDEELKLDTDQEQLGWLYILGDLKAKFNLPETEFEGWQQTYNVLNQTIQQNPNINCILAFSQGAFVASILLAYYQTNLKENPLKNLKCVILFSGLGQPLPSNQDLAFLKSFANKQNGINVASLHVIGETDIFIPNWRSELLYEWYSQPKQIYKHPGGHFVPTKKENLDIYLQFLKEKFNII